MGKGCGCGASKAARVPSVSAQPVAQEEDDETFWHLYVSWTDEDEQNPERLITKPPSASASYSTTGAVRLSYLLDFVTTRLPMGDPFMPTWSVALNLVQPATSELGVPYTSLPEMKQHVLPYGTTTPYYFVSHAWSRPLREAVDMLAHHFRGCDPQEVYVWLDIFAVRQQTFTATPKGPDMAMLDAALRNSAGVLLCLDETALALRRTWCLYEAWVGATAPALGAVPNGPIEAAAAAAAAGGGGGGSGGGGDDAERAAGTAGASTAEEMAAEARPASVAGRGGTSSALGAVKAPAAAATPIGVIALTPRAMLPEERARLFSKIDIRQSRCKYKADRDALFEDARAAAGPGGLDAVNSVLQLAFMLRPLVADVSPDLKPGRMVEVPELWDMSKVDAWLALPETNRQFSAMALYGPACSGKSIAAAAVARHLSSLGIPLAAHFCNVSDVRTLDPVAIVVSLALQLAQAPGIGPQLLRQYGELPAGLLADLVSYNNTPAALEAAVEALLVQPLQKLLQPEIGSESAAAAGGVEAAANDGSGGRGWHDNGDMGALGGGCDEELEAGGDGARGLLAVGAKSVRMPGTWQGPPQVVVLIIDGVDQADGAIMGGAAPFDNQVLQLIEDHLTKLPSFVRLVLTSRSLSYIVPRLADRVCPMELAPDLLRPMGPFLRNIRLAITTIDPSLSHRHRAAVAANLVAKSHGSMLYIKMALCCLELERDVAVAEAEADLMVAAVASYNGRTGSGVANASATPTAPTSAQRDGVRRTLSRLASSKKPNSTHQFPSSVGGLLERYLTIRLRLLNSTELRNQAATVLAVLAAAREPLTAMQVAATVSGNGSGWYGSKAYTAPGTPVPEAPPPLLAPPPVATTRLLQDFVLRGLGSLVRLRGPPGHWAQEVLLVHSTVSEWLRRPKPRVFLGGSVLVDLAAGNRALASYCRDDTLSCLYRGRLQPYGYSVRHIFLHAGLAAMTANAAESAGPSEGGTGGVPVSPSFATTCRSSGGGNLRSRSGTYSYNSSSAVTLAAALAAAAATADWIAILELLLQRLDLWTSIYTAGAGSATRWVVLALASLPMCSIPSADPGSTDSPLLMLLAEARRWLLLYHRQLCWFPLAVIASAATLPEDSALRTRALELSAGEDPWEYHQPTVTTITVMPAHTRGATKTMEAAAAPPTDAAAAAAYGGGTATTGTAITAPSAAAALSGGGGSDNAGVASSLDEPPATEHLLLLSTGDFWSACMQTLRSNMGRVLHVAMQPAGRLVATVHDVQRGIILWDIWGAKSLLTFARSHEMGPNPTAAFFTPDGRKLVCAARSVFVWDVSTGRLLMELCKAPPRKAGAGTFGALLGGAGGSSSAPAAGSGGSGDPDGPVTALALSPGGGRVAAGHANGTTRVWDITTGKMLMSMAVQHRRTVTALAFSPPRGATLLTAHGEGSDAAPKAVAPIGFEELGDVPTALIKADELPIHVWRIQGNSAKELEVLKGHTGRVNTLAFSSLDRTMMTGSMDETIRAWRNDTTTPQSDYRQTFLLGGAGNGVVHTIQFSPMPPTPPTPPQLHQRRNASSLLSLRTQPPAAQKSSNGYAADGDAESPVVDFTAPSASCLATAAFGTNAEPLSDTGGAATPDAVSTPVSARGSAAGTIPEGDGSAAAAIAAAAATAVVASRGGGSGGDEDDSAEDEVRGDLPVMAYSCGTGIIRLWSPLKKRQIGLLRGMEGVVSSLSFSGDGRLLASADQSDAGVVRIWDVGGASVDSPLECSPSTGAGGLPLRHPVEVMSLSPDGSRLAIVCADLGKESLRVIDVFTGRRMALMGPGGAGGHDRKINTVAWSWDSSRVATGSDDLTVRVWYVGKPTAPPGNELATAAAIVAAGMARGSTAPPPPPATPPPPPKAAAMTAAKEQPTPSSRAVPSWQSKRAIVDDMSASRHLARLPSATPSIGAENSDAAANESTGRGNGGAENTAGAAAAAATEGVHGIRPGHCQLILEGHHRKVQCVTWAHNGKKLASGGYDQMIRIWDSSTGEQLNLIYQVSWVSALAFSPDDARLASGGGSRSVYIFNSSTGRNLAAYSGPLPGDAGGREEPATAAAVVAATARTGSAAAAAAAAEAAAAKKADREGEAEDAGPSASGCWMAALRFNPDGTLLACRDLHSAVTLWDVSGMRLKPIRTLDGTFREAIFCPTSGDLQLYDLTESGALVMSAIPAVSLPLGRAVQRAVALSHPLLEFRGVAVDTAVNHNGLVLLTADNRAFFFVNGAHLAAVRKEASRAQRTPGSAVLSSSGGGSGWSVTTVGSGGGGGGEQSLAVSRVPSMRS